MFEYQYKGKTVQLHFGMLFMEHFWTQIGDEFTGSDYLATLLYFGGKVHQKLNGGALPFESKAQAYRFIADNYEDAEFLEMQARIIEDFQKTNEYKSVFAASEEAKKKLTEMR